jgi:hypothetical protein
LILLKRLLQDALFLVKLVADFYHLFSRFRDEPKFITLAEEIYLEPCKRMQFSKVGRIPPTEVGGYFKSNLQQKLQAALNPSDGSRRIFQIQPMKAGLGLLLQLPLGVSKREPILCVQAGFVSTPNGSWGDAVEAIGLLKTAPVSARVRKKSYYTR